MSTTLEKLLHYLDEVLQPDKFRDYCPNGLQVEGRDRVHRSHLLLEVFRNVGTDCLHTFW